MIVKRRHYETLMEFLRVLNCLGLLPDTNYKRTPVLDINSLSEDCLPAYYRVEIDD